MYLIKERPCTNKKKGTPIISTSARERLILTQIYDR